MDIQVMDANPIYQGETYRLKFEFSSNYPIGIERFLSTLSSQTDHFLQSRQKLSLSAILIALFPSTLTSTLTVSSVWIYSHLRDGRRCRMSRVFVSAFRAC
jgi:hypothetical protein